MRDSLPDLPQARCRDIDDPDLFFPDTEESDPSVWKPQAAEAKKVCAECPVRVRCRDYAAVHREHYGVWGGELIRPNTAANQNIRWRRLRGLDT